MKTNIKTLLSIILLSTTNLLFAQNVGINTTGSTPSSNAILDLNTGNTYNAGLLLPHVGLGASLSTFGLAGAATTKDTGMFIYNMSPTYHSTGLYYWSGSTWVLAAATGGVLSSIPITSTYVNNYTMSSGYYYVFYNTAYINPSGSGGSCAVTGNTTLSTVLGTVTNNVALSNAGYVVSSDGLFSKAFIWFSPSVSSGTLTISVYKFTPTNGGNLTTALSYTLLDSGSTTVSSSSKLYSLEVDGSATSTFSKGDELVLIYHVSANMYIYMIGSLEVEYQ